MAGGGGTRFWPLSRKQTPKQLLNLSGRDMMVNEAASRLAQVTSYDNIYIVTNHTQTPKMREVTQKNIMPEHILSYPFVCIGRVAVLAEKMKLNFYARKRHADAFGHFRKKDFFPVLNG